MDPYMEHTNKHLENFNQFAGNFTKAFIPIVDTAIKMSTGEPVSAYSVFKAAKIIADSRRKSKKSNGTAAAIKGKGGHKNNKGKVKKLALAKEGGTTKTAGNVNKQNARRSVKAEANKSKSNDVAYSSNEKVQSIKKSNPATVKKPDQKPKVTIKDTDVLTLDNPTKKLHKNAQQKDFKEYLVKQLELIENASEEGEDSFSSDILDELTDFDEFSDENTINENSYSAGEETISQDEAYTDESSSTNEEDNQKAEALAQAIITRANKKRKNTETSASTAKMISTNEVSEKSKKVKKFEEPKTISRKSLQEVKNEKSSEEPKRKSSSMACVEDLNKISTHKSSTRNISTTATVKLEPLSPPLNVIKVNSIEEGKRAFKWLLNPVDVSDFFSKYWEQKACLIKRQQSNYVSHLISFESIDQMLLKNHVEFTKNIDVTSYKNGIRETLNPEGRAMPPVVWDHYGLGCSIRLLNPQTFLHSLYILSSTMQEYFQCLVGANAYLTPPNSQGFAPHYDDIEAFVLQIEGRKRWKLYKPRNKSEILPRFSSKNFSQEEIGKPVLEEVLEPGDVLYFPRGTIHQACTEPGYHSLHITLSVYQKQSYADLFEKMLPLMLKKAISTNVDLRRGLPLHAWQHAGIAYSDNSTKERADLTEKVTKLMQKCIRDMPLQDIMDSAIDQLAKKFQHEALPPEVLYDEKQRTVFGSRSRTNERGECVCDYDIDERTNVRLLRANILRLVEEEEKIRIYYYLDNSKEYCEYEPNFIEIEAVEAASIEVLIKSYPQYVGVSQLPLPSDDQKITLATALWERGLLMMEKPFK